MKQASVLLATALANRVFPVPGGPKRRTPFGGSIPRVTNLSGCEGGREEGGGRYRKERRGRSEERGGRERGREGGGGRRKEERREEGVRRRYFPSPSHMK